MDEHFKKRIMELSEQSYTRDILRYTDFLDMEEQALYHSMKRELGSERQLLFGGHEDADRNVLMFLPDYMEEDYRLIKEGDLSRAEALSVVSMLELRPVNERFSDELSHRDFLGALMNLGIERKKTGDILTDGKKAYIFLMSDIADFVAKELTKVKHTNVICSIKPLSDCGIRPRLEELKVNAASERADAVAAAVFKLSRETASKLVSGGLVYVSGRELSKASYELKEGDRVSVRGYGKFIYHGVENTTKKGRLYLRISKYV
ncbi:MAG TPA: RNA-binding protein [Candidatus Avilachnospira avistercoris]|nr:RNA-binding protein [Candidatus Avilachnospira avistercoris]